MASACTSLLLRSKPVQRNYRHFFKDLKPNRAFKGLIFQKKLWHCFQCFEQVDWATVRSSLCPFGLMSVRATVLLGVCLVGLISIKLLPMGRCPVRLLSSLVTALSGYCLSGKCPSGCCLSGMCPRGSVHRASARSAYCLDTLQKRCS